MTLNPRHLLFVMMILMGAGASVVTAQHGGGSAAGPAVGPLRGEIINFEDCKTCYAEDGKLAKLEEALLENPQMDEELKKAVSGFVGLARERADDPNMRKWVHENLEQLYPTENIEGSARPTIPQWVKSSLIESVPPVALKPQTPSSPDSPPLTSRPQPNQLPSADFAVKPPTQRPLLLPGKDSGNPWLMHPDPRMEGQPENLEGRIGAFSRSCSEGALQSPTDFLAALKPTPTPPMVLTPPAPLVISQRPDSVLPEVLRAGSTPNATQNTFSEKPTIAPPNLPSTVPSKEGFSNQSATPAGLAPSLSPKPSPNLAAALPAQAAPVAKEVAPTVVVISQAAPQQMALSEKKPESEKAPKEKNNLKSEEGASSSPSAGVVLIQNTQQAASLPAPQNISSSEVKALSANKKVSKILPDFSSAFGRLKEILHGKKTGTGSAPNQVVLNQREKAQSEKDHWAVERSPASWESNGGGLEAVDKGRSSISFASFKAWAGMAAAMSALMAFFAYLFYKKQMQNLKPTWVEVIIDHPSLRKRPARKVKSLTES